MSWYKTPEDLGAFLSTAETHRFHFSCLRGAKLFLLEGDAAVFVEKAIKYVAMFQRTILPIYIYTYIKKVYIYIFRYAYTWLYCLMIDRIQIYSHSNYRTGWLQYCQTSLGHQSTSILHPKMIGEVSPQHTPFDVLQSLLPPSSEGKI